MEKPLLAIKLKNAFLKASAGYNFDIQLKNVIINHEKRGCGGFIINPENNNCVYITTDCSYCNMPIMYRYADDNKDFTGHTNRWCKTIDELVSSVTKMLLTAPEERKL